MDSSDEEGEGEEGGEGEDSIDARDDVDDVGSANVDGRSLMRTLQVGKRNNMREIRREKQYERNNMRDKTRTCERDKMRDTR